VTYSVKKHRFSSEGDLLSFLGGLHFAPGERVGIIAGHFMLMYDDQADCLVPMIYQDAANPKVKELSQKLAGEFPLRTFKLGVRLTKDYQGKEIASTLALIVNDHIFQTDGWSVQNLKHKDRAGDLRHDFYRQKYPIPKSFFAELRSSGLTTEVILDNDNASRTPTDILPKTTRLFSEQALRNYFDENTRLDLRKLPMFKEVRQNETKSKLMFTGEAGDSLVCLTEEGACGCSGELIEFFARLATKFLNGLVFFVPDECRIAVDAGIKAFFHTPEQYRSGLSSVYVVSGLGGMGVSDARTINLTIHKLSQQL
jgi:hypothetical protein